MAIHLLTDAQLIEKLEKKGNGVIEEIFKRYFHILFSHSVRMLHNKDLAKQVVQEIFVTLLSDPGEVKSYSALDCYLYDRTRTAIMLLLFDGKVRPVEHYLKRITESNLSESEQSTSQEERDANLRKIFESEIPGLPPEVQDKLNC